MLLHLLGWPGTAGSPGPSSVIGIKEIVRVFG